MKGFTKLTNEKKTLVIKIASWLMKNPKILGSDEGNKAVGLIAKIVSKGYYSNLEQDFLNQIREKYVKHIKKETKF